MAPSLSESLNDGQATNSAIRSSPYLATCYQMTRMKAVSEIRLENLEALVQEAGTAESLAERADLSPVYLSQIRSRTVDRKTGKPRNLGDKAARKLEAGMGKQLGWMDAQHSPVAAPGAPSPLPRSLKLLRMVRGLTASELAASSGIAAERLSEIDAGLELSNGEIHALAAVFDLSAEELSTQHLKSLDAARELLDMAQRRIHNPMAPRLIGQEHGVNDEELEYIGPLTREPRRIPVVGIAQLGENGYYDELEFPVGHGDGFLQHHSRDTQAYALKVRGDSMTPAIRNGWYVLVEPNSLPRPGEYVALMLADGRKMAKELLFQHRDGGVEVMSVNGSHRLSFAASQVEKIHPIVGVFPPSQVREF